MSPGASVVFLTASSALGGKLDPLACTDGRIIKEQEQACQHYESDRACCDAFKKGGQCNIGGHFYPASRYDKYCQMTCGFCHDQLGDQLGLLPSSFPLAYEPTATPSHYCGDNDFKAVFPIICFAFKSSLKCCESHENAGGCKNGGMFSSGGQYHGFCARSCAYCGPTGTPTFTPPTLVPSTMVPSTSQIPTALCNDGFLLRDAKKFLRRKLGLPELCVNSWSSTSCCRGLQRHGECKAELADDGILFGYCSRTCGYCGFEAYDFQEHHFEPEPLSHVHLDSEEVMGKVSSFVVCGAIAAGFFCACLVALLLFLNHTFDTSNAKLKRGAKLVALSTLCFTGSAFLVAGVGCAPDTAMRNAHGVLNDLEIDEMDLSVVAENVRFGKQISFRILSSRFTFPSQPQSRPSSRT
mmetsp:Transcript_32163/g.99327  ORF Transcript_32163/g.99327 Transcript_32163/m.99327 type:complete len:410 (+) Transcript_32163:717-1946(+)